MRKSERMKRILSVLLCAVLLFGMMPVQAMAAEECAHPEYVEGICTVCGAEEPEHTHIYTEGECECGAVCPHEAYAEGVCTACGAEEPVHTHVYTEGKCECGEVCPHDEYAEGVCTVCGAEEPAQEPEVQTVTEWSWVDDYEIVDSEYQDAVIPGVSAQNPIDWETLVELLPAYITAVVDGEEVEIPVTWECEDFPEEAVTGGTYVFTAVLPEGYALDESVAALTLKVDLGQAEVQADVPDGYTGYNIESGSVSITSSGKYYIYGTGTATTNTITVSGSITADIILDNVNITISSDSSGCAFQLKNGATVNLTLQGTNTLSSNDFAGLQVPGGTKVTIGGSGELTAKSQSGGAGIGAEDVDLTNDPKTLGTIVINGGTIEATGYGGCAGIGGSKYGTTGSITINGGNVKATSRVNVQNYGGAGIGGGYSGCVQNITITGGTVNATAQSPSMAAGIGSGYNASNAGESLSCGTILITGGTITAQSGGTHTAAIGYGGAYANSGGGSGGSVTFQNNPLLTLHSSMPGDDRYPGFIDPAPAGDYYRTAEISFSIIDVRIKGSSTVTGTFVVKDGDKEIANETVTLTDRGSVVNGTGTIVYVASGNTTGLTRTLTINGITYTDTNDIDSSFTQETSYKEVNVEFEVKDGRLMNSGEGTFVIKLDGEELVNQPVSLTVSEGVATGYATVIYDSSKIEPYEEYSRTLSFGGYTYTHDTMFSRKFTCQTSYVQQTVTIKVTDSRLYGASDPQNWVLKILDDNSDALSEWPVTVKRIDDNSYGATVVYVYDSSVVDENTTYSRQLRSTINGYFNYYLDGKVSDDFIVDVGTRHLAIQCFLEAPHMTNGYKTLTLTLSQGNTTISYDYTSAYFSQGVMDKKLTWTPNLSAFSKTDPITRTLTYEGETYYTDQVAFDELSKEIKTTVSKGTVTLQVICPEVTQNLAVSEASINYSGHTPAATWYSIGDQVTHKENGMGEITATLPLGRELTVSVKIPGINGGNAITHTFTPKDGDTVVIWADAGDIEPIEAYCGQKLSELTLPSGWEWDDDTQLVGDVTASGEYREHAATHTYGETANVKVTVKPSGADVDFELVDANGDPVTSYTYGDTIYVKTTVKPNGKAPEDYEDLGVSADLNAIKNAIMIVPPFENIMYVTEGYSAAEYVLDTPVSMPIGTKDSLGANFSQLSAGTHTLWIVATSSSNTGWAIEEFEVTVNKATPTVTQDFFAAGTYGESVNDLTVTSGSISVPFTTSWADTDKDKLPTVADNGKTPYDLLVIPNDSTNYKTVTVQPQIEVRPLEVQVTVTAKDKVYDGTTTAEVDTVTFTNKVGEDDVTLTGGTAAFAAAEVGEDIAVTFSGWSLSGADAGNYVLKQQPAAATATITPKAYDEVDIAGTSALLYDRQPHGITVTPMAKQTVSGTQTLLPVGDAVVKYGTTEGVYDLDTSPTFTNVGNHTVYYQITHKNYETVTGSAVVEIQTTELSVSGIQAKDKAYDGNQTAELDYSAITFDVESRGANVSTDGLTVTATGEFASKNVGEDITVALSDLKLVGEDAENFLLNPQVSQTETAASISPKEITVSITPNGGVYGDTIKAAEARLNDLVTGDDPAITLTYTGTAYDGTEEDGTETPTQAGTYNVAASITDGNYELTGDTDAEFMVEKAPVEPPVIAPKPYTGGTLTADVESTAIYDVIANEGGIEAGDYNVDLQITDANYKWADSDEAVKTLTFRITQAENAWAVDSAPADSEWGYGELNALTASAKFGEVKVEYRSADAENGDAAYTQFIPVSAGSYLVRFSVAETANYAGLSEVKTLQITKAPLTLKAENVFVTYGDAAPDFSVIGSGFQLDDTLDSLDDTNASITSIYKQYDGVDTYEIVPSGYASNNYDISYEIGTLTVEQKEVIIQWSEDPIIFKEGIAQAPVAKAFNAVNGDVLTLTVEGAQIDAGTGYTATVTGITGEKAGNYKLPMAVSTQYAILNASQPAPEVGSQNETVAKKADGKITDVSSAMEYRAENETDYTAIEGEEIADLTPGKYYVRYAEKTNYHASADTEVIIGAGARLNVIVPAQQQGYELTAAAAELDWLGGTTLTFTLKDGYSAEELCVSAEGAELTDNGDGTYSVASATGDVTVSVTGVCDVEAPTVSIQVDTNKWNSFLNTVTFGLFFKQTQTVTVTADDSGSGVGNVYYYLSDTQLTLDQVKAITVPNARIRAGGGWNVYEGPFNIEPDAEYVIYALAVDNAGNAVYVNADGIVLDATAPAIMGVENGNTYYGDATVRVSDGNFDSVTVDGKAITLTDGAFTVQADNAEHTIVAVDKAGNATEYKITVYKIYTVTYMADGKVVDTQAVEHGKDAVVPEIPAKDGYTAAWDADGKNITADTTVTALYTEVTDSTEPEQPSDPQKPADPEKPTESEKPTKPADPDKPATGDESSVVLHGIVFVMSFAALAVLLFAFKKRRQAS